MQTFELPVEFGLLFGPALEFDGAQVRVVSQHQLVQEHVVAIVNQLPGEQRE